MVLLKLQQDVENVISFPQNISYLLTVQGRLLLHQVIRLQSSMNMTFS